MISYELQYPSETSCSQSTTHPSSDGQQLTSITTYPCGDHNSASSPPPCAAASWELEIRNGLIPKFKSQWSPKTGLGAYFFLFMSSIAAILGTWSSVRLATLGLHRSKRGLQFDLDCGFRWGDVYKRAGFGGGHWTSILPLVLQRCILTTLSKYILGRIFIAWSINFGTTFWYTKSRNLSSFEHLINNLCLLSQNQILGTSSTQTSLLFLSGTTAWRPDP